MCDCLYYQVDCTRLFGNCAFDSPSTCACIWNFPQIGLTKGPVQSSTAVLMVYNLHRPAKYSVFHKINSAD